MRGGFWWWFSRWFQGWWVWHAQDGLPVARHGHGLWHGPVNDRPDGRRAGLPVGQQQQPAAIPAAGLALPTEGQPAAAPANQDTLAQLKLLGELHDKGVLTDDEFTREKNRLLGH